MSLTASENITVQSTSKRYIMTDHKKELLQHADWRLNLWLLNIKNQIERVAGFNAESVNNIRFIRQTCIYNVYVHFFNSTASGWQTAPTSLRATASFKPLNWKTYKYLELETGCKFSVINIWAARAIVKRCVSQRGGTQQISSICVWTSLNISYREGLQLSKQSQISLSSLVQRDMQSSPLVSGCLSPVWSLSNYHMDLFSAE